MEAPFLAPSSQHRDLDSYQAFYTAPSFEPVQAALRKRIILSHLGTWQSRTILEVGCGMAPIFVEYQDFDALTVVEPGASFAEHARKLAVNDHRIDIIEALLEDAAKVLPLREKKFDTILVAGLLHELADPASLMRALLPLCTPETRLHVSVANARSLHRLLALEMGLISTIRERSERQIAQQQHFTFDMNDLVNLCQSAGYSVVEQGSYFIKPFSHAQMKQLMDSGFMNENMLDGLMKLERHLPGMGSEIYANLKPAI